MVFILKLLLVGAKFKIYSFTLQLGLLIADDSVGELIRIKMKAKTHNDAQNYL